MKKIVICFFVVILAVVGCGDSKPSKGELKQSLRNVLLEGAGSDTKETKDKIGDYSDCIIDKIYEDFSVETLNKFLNMKNSNDLNAIEGSEKENEILDKARTDCSQKLVDD